MSNTNNLALCVCLFGEVESSDNDIIWSSDNASVHAHIRIHKVWHLGASVTIYRIFLHT